jgi:hypothetical protein
LDISYNNLTGNIPNSYVSIKTVNLSYNSLTGTIPRDFDQYHTSDTLIGNKYLCGDSMGFPHCLPTINKSIVTKAKICVPIAISLGFLVLGAFSYVDGWSRKPNMSQDQKQIMGTCS